MKPYLEDHLKRYGEVSSLVFEDKEYTNLWIRESSNCLAGSAPVADELHKGFEKELNIKVLEAYGLSESCSAVVCTHHNEVRKPGSAGTAIGKAVISIYPALAGATVIGIKDEKYGEEVMAFVIKHASLP